MTRTLTRTIFIAASPQEVFTFISSPRHMPEWIPSMAEVSEITGEGLGANHWWVYQAGAFTPTLAGVQLTGRSVVTDFSPPSYLQRRTSGLAHSTWDFELRPVVEGTELTMRITYRVPVPLVGRAVEAWITRHNETVLDVAVRNAKRAVEHRRLRPHQTEPANRPLPARAALAAISTDAAPMLG